MKINEIDIVYRVKHPVPANKITSSYDAAEILRSIWDDDINWRESFYVLYLNQRNRVKSVQCVGKGSINSCMADIRIIMAAAVKTLCSGIIVSHNHPSEESNASQQDIALTKRLKQAADIFDIRLLDHVILTPDAGYFSFADEGLL